MYIFVVTRDNVPFRAFTGSEDADLYMRRKIIIYHDHCCACECDLYWKEHIKQWQLPKWNIISVNIIEDKDSDEMVKKQYTYNAGKDDDSAGGDDDDQNIIVFLIYVHDRSSYTNEKDKIISAHFTKESIQSYIKELPSNGFILYKSRTCKLNKSCLYKQVDENSAGYINDGSNDIAEYKDDAYNFTISNIDDI